MRCGAVGLKRNTWGGALRLPNLLSCLLLCMGGATFAQQVADTLHLGAVEVAKPRLAAFSAGTKVQRVDSATLARYANADLGTLLANETPVFVKSYGLGGLATTSFRGGSANHTAILWNGINIGSPMNGQSDLSLIPMGVADAVSIQYGGGTALWGSGALGGSIHLENKPHFGQGLQVAGGVAMGSFGENRQQLHGECSTERSATTIGLYNSAAANNFRFTTGQHREQRMPNATFRQYGVLLGQQLRVGKADRVGIHYWGQLANREVPPTLQQELSTAFQVDASHRVMADWHHAGATWGTVVRAALLDERLDWYGSADSTAATSRAQTLVAEAELRLRPAGPHLVDMGVNGTFAEASGAGYPKGVRQGRQALFALYRYHPAKGGFTGSASVRQEWQDGRSVPLTGSIGLEYRMRPWAVLKAQGAKLYRLPAFNDLYWQPGGNPGLLPEDGFSSDLGVALQHRWKRWDLRTEITWFNRTVQNWIIWLPGPAWWSPGNIMQVWSRGVETDSRIVWKQGRSTWLLGAITNYVVSTNQVAKSRYDEGVDKQLIYVPMYSGNARIGWQRERCSVTLSGTFTGYRYTSTDNRDFLPPYWLLNARASVRVLENSRWHADAFVQGSNMLGAEYQVVMDRPMPLQSILAGVGMRYSRPNKTKLATP